VRKLMLILAIAAGLAAPVVASVPADAGPCNNAVGKWIC
jgi:hypothetical protein